MLCKEDMDQDGIARHKHEGKDLRSSEEASRTVLHTNVASDRNRMEGQTFSHRSTST